MLIELGQVVSVEADCLWVQTLQRSACDSCSARSGCGQGLLSRWSARAGQLRVLLNGRDPNAYQVGDEVKVGVPESVVALGSLWVYLLPLMGLMAALMLAQTFAATEGQLVLSALAGMLLGGAIVRWHAWYARNDRRLQPVIVD